MSLVQRRGRFITVEGGEGAGKSTQTGRLVEWLRGRGLTVQQTREPGGVPGAEEIRSLLVQGEPNRWHPLSETLLMYAARCEHWHRRIAPALSQGEWVVCDRFHDSSLAYQGAAHGILASDLEALFHFAAPDAHPDLTFVLDVPVDRGLERVQQRLGNENRFERMGTDFHQKVRNAFRAIAEKNPQRCQLIDGTSPPQVVWEEIEYSVSKRFFCSNEVL